MCTSKVFPLEALSGSESYNRLIIIFFVFQKHLALQEGNYDFISRVF